MQKVSASFRDPDNQVFINSEGHIIREIRPAGVAHYRRLMDSGLYRDLTAKNLIIPHTEERTENGSVFIKPRKVPFISYPAEWCFSALKSAALTTLETQKTALEHGMTLQDASAFNIQFLDGRWMHIDTGSFRIQETPAPWRAYRQFCEHFLAPLCLMSYCDPRTLSLLRKYGDGIPLDLAAKLLPLRARLNLTVLLHICLHSRFLLRDFGGTASVDKKSSVSQASQYGLLDQLSSFIRKLEIKKQATAWTDYEDTHTYDTAEFRDKENFVTQALTSVSPRTVWDLGANTGHFSRLSTAKNRYIVAFEYDLMTCEAGYRKTASVKGTDAPLHLWMDLMNPTPSSGWAQKEWPGMKERGSADLTLALALIHHLCLANNLPLDRVASFMAEVSSNIVIEFVPKSDPQSQRLLKTKGDIFPDYNIENFEAAFAAHFNVTQRKEISKTGRTLYLMNRR